MFIYTRIYPVSCNQSGDTPRRDSPPPTPATHPLSCPSSPRPRLRRPRLGVAWRGREFLMGKFAHWIEDIGYLFTYIHISLHIYNRVLGSLCAEQFL